MIEAYFTHLLILIFIYTILAVSLQVTFGFGGLLNLGHIAFFGVGAYITALLSIRGFSVTIYLLASILVTGLFGWFLSILTRKLKGDYFALVTLGFSFVVYAVLLNWKEVTGGPLGLPDIPRPDMFGFILSDNSAFLLFVLCVTLISCFFMYKVCSSPFGKALQATRDDELAARSLGKNTKKIKAISLIVSACFAGIAGSLFASYIAYIEPSTFTFITFAPVLLMVIIGGLGSLYGTVLAVIIIVLLPEPLRFIGLPPSILGPLRQMIYATILLLVLYFIPRGFYGKVNLE